MPNDPIAGVIPLEEAFQKLADKRKKDLPKPPNEVDPKTYVTLLTNGTMSVELYAPFEKDEQTPHTQDELYVIARGSGTFEREGKTAPFVAGDTIFVPANDDHRFINYTEDFATWVFFYGPEVGPHGGEFGGISGTLLPHYLLCKHLFTCPSVQHVGTSRQIGQFQLMLQR